MDDSGDLLYGVSRLCKADTVPDECALATATPIDHTHEEYTCDALGRRIAKTRRTTAMRTTSPAAALDTVATMDGDFADDSYFCAPVVKDGNNAFDYAQRIPNGVDSNSVDDWETLYGIEFGDAADPSSPGT